jgi:hypothetical protein
MMQNLLKRVLICGLLLLTDHAATAQTQSAACPPSGKSARLMQVGSVTGCPFSAVLEITETQTLADGTYIQKKSKALVYRDSLGRIRYESYLFEPIGKEIPEPPNMIQIFDPVDGFTYWLTPRNAVATRRSLNEAETSSKVNAQPQHSSVQASASTQPQEPRPKSIVEKLGTQLMEGLLVTGRRTTLTIPAGWEGNDRPLVIVSEVWDSSDMGLRLLVKISDPRTGDTERRITNLSRTEPDPSLFRVPADYTMKGE